MIAGNYPTKRRCGSRSCESPARGGMTRVPNARTAAPDVSGVAIRVRQPVVEPDPGEGLDRVWRTSIMPLLEEHHYGQSTDLEQRYGLAALRKVLVPAFEDEAVPFE